MRNILIDLGIILTYISIIGSVALILFFAIKAVIKSFKRAQSGLIGLALLVIILVISYILSSSTDIPPEVFEKTGVNIAYSKIIGGGVITLYWVILCLVAVIIYSRISKFIKR